MRRRRTSGGRSTATTGVERRHSNRSNPAGLEHRKKSHPSDDSFFYLFESTRRDSNPRPSPWQGDTPPLSHSCILCSLNQNNIHYTHVPLVCQLLFLFFTIFVNVNTQRSPNLSKNAFLHFAQMHPLVFVCFDTLLSLCSKKSH